MKEPANAQLLRQTVALNKLFDEKAFSWTLTMESLETVLPGGVQVVTLEPVREKNGETTLHMRVLGPRDKGVVFVSNLESSKRFMRPRIVDESAESTNGPAQQLGPVSPTNRFSFDLQAEYNPPTSEELKAEKTAEKTPAAAEEPEVRPRRIMHVERVPERPPFREPHQPMPLRAKPNPDGYANPGGPQ